MNTARTKKNTVSKSNDWIIKLIVLLIALLAIISFVVSLIIYKINLKETKDWNDYQKYEIKDTNLFEKEGEYYVLCYSKYSNRCNEVKSFIFQYLDSEYNSKKYARLYLFSLDNYPDYATATASNENIVDVTKETLDTLQIAYFPTLFVIDDNSETNIPQIMAEWTGVEKIKSALSEIPNIT